MDDNLIRTIQTFPPAWRKRKATQPPGTSQAIYERKGDLKVSACVKNSLVELNLRQFVFALRDFQ